MFSSDFAGKVVYRFFVDVLSYTFVAKNEMPHVERQAKDIGIAKYVHDTTVIA